MSIYDEVPFLAVLEKRKDLLPEDPSNPGKEVIETASEHLRRVLFSKRVRQTPIPPRVFFVEANLVAFSPSQHLWERFCKYYADLSLTAFARDYPLLRRYYPRRDLVAVREILSVRRPYNEIKLYHLEVVKGKVYLGDKEPFFSASLLFNDMFKWMKEKVRNVVLSGALSDLQKIANSVLAPPIKKKTRKYSLIQRLINASGLPDGRKRILFFWLIPYWVTVEGKSPEEALDLSTEWLSRQGGSKIYTSWILSEAENAKNKGIKPWSLEKVERIDPELVKLLRGMGIL